MWKCSVCHKYFKSRALLIVHVGSCNDSCFGNRLDLEQSVFTTNDNVENITDMDKSSKNMDMQSDVVILNIENNAECWSFENVNIDSMLDDNVIMDITKDTFHNTPLSCNQQRNGLAAQSTNIMELKGQSNNNAECISEIEENGIHLIEGPANYTDIAEENGRPTQEVVLSITEMDNVRPSDESTIIQSDMGNRDISNNHTMPKRTKGVRQRDLQMKKKESGMEYVNRKGKTIPSKNLIPIIDKCCRMNCHLKCPSHEQQKIFDEFISKSKEAKHEILSGRIILSKKAVGRGGNLKNRSVSASYTLTVGVANNIKVCKKMFYHVHGVTRFKIDTLICKLKKSHVGLTVADNRGRHVPSNKLVEERDQMTQFINKYPRHVSHYARRDNCQKIYLPSHLTIKKMYEEYKEYAKNNDGRTNIAGYDVFRNIFNKMGLKFKQPYADTCKKCDEYKLKKRLAGSESERQELNTYYDKHIQEAEKAYTCKKEDKELTKRDHTKALLVFDLQQVLPAPFLSTNVAYYKRLLSTYNLTIRNCLSQEDTECYMWHEAVGGRGSDQIASCVYKNLLSLPESIKHVITYSDTCGGQNRNINMAVMFSYVMAIKQFDCIDQKFLLPGHTRMECDSDHARIERYKKQIGPDNQIMSPRDWYTFVRMISKNNSKFKVSSMVQEDFLAFSLILKKDLVKKQNDSDGNKIDFMKIKWFRYTKTFGVVYFKHTLNENEPFRTMDLRRNKRTRQLNASNIDCIPHSYSSSLPINAQKKRDLLSLFSLIDKDCHEFYNSLKTADDIPEFDELEDNDIAMCLNTT